MLALLYKKRPCNSSKMSLFGLNWTLKVEFHLYSKRNLSCFLEIHTISRRSEQSVNLDLAEMYDQGVSTVRKTIEVLQKLVGLEVQHLIDGVQPMRRDVGRGTGGVAQPPTG